MVSSDKDFIGVAPTAGSKHSPKQPSVATATVKVIEPALPPELSPRPSCAALRLFQEWCVASKGTAGAEWLLLPPVPLGRGMLRPERCHPCLGSPAAPSAWEKACPELAAPALRSRQARQVRELLPVHANEMIKMCRAGVCLAAVQPDQSESCLLPGSKCTWPVPTVPSPALGSSRMAGSAEFCPYPTPPPMFECLESGAERNWEEKSVGPVCADPRRMQPSPSLLLVEAPHQGLPHAGHAHHPVPAALQLVQHHPRRVVHVVL